MKNRYSLFLTVLAGASCLLQSCARNSNDVWEDTKSAGRHMQRGFRALGGKHGASRQVQCRDEFNCIDDGCFYEDTDYFQESKYETQNSCDDCCHQDFDYQDNQSQACEFVPLQDQVNEVAMADIVAPQAQETPGEAGSSIPGIEAFRDPSTIPQIASIFRPIYFEYNSNLIKGSQNLAIIRDIAYYMRRSPNTYLFIEGHTDERGPQAYNLALGSRRSNAVRNLLINEGVNPDNLFTISYGKERPVVMESHEEGWAKNRRAEFKIYER